jgi:hypothetical protein
MTRSAGSDDPAAHVLSLLAGKWLAAAVCAAATLGLPDALAKGPRSLERLASELGCDPSALARLLRVLVGERLVRENQQREFELLEAGRLLCREGLGRLARYVGSPIGWDPWSDLAQAVRTGESAFEKRYGAPLFEHLDRHAADAALYDEAIEAFAGREAAALAEAYDFAGARRVLDVGGGRGGLLVALLARHPHLSGVLLERPAAAHAARQAFARAGLAGRCEVVVGDFFEALPEGADHLVLKHIVHSWDDETATALLARCARAVGAAGRILIVEGVLVRDGRRSLINMLDLEMLVLCGPGHERTKPELRRLFAGAGLELVASQPLTETGRLFVTQSRIT